MTGPHGTRRRVCWRKLWFTAWMMMGVLTIQPLYAAKQQATITPNYKDADIRQVIEAVGEVTGKNFVIDPRVKAQVTMFSASPMTPDAFYEAFLSILQVYGFVAVPAGNVIKVIPDANARQLPGSEFNTTGVRMPDDLVTEVITVQNISAAQLVPILRPLIPQYGHLAAYPAANMLIISDRANNVDRMIRIIRRIDTDANEDFEVIRLEHASAVEVVRIITALGQATKTEGGASAPAVADERTNSVLLSGEKNQRLRLRALVAHLDTPLQQGGDTQVRYLRYADSSDLATKLQAQFQKQAAGAATPGAAAATGPKEQGEISIWSDDATNALIITAPPKTMHAVMAIVDKLDIRRLQVLVEGVIVEITSDKLANLGVTWAAGSKNLQDAIGVTKFDNTTGVVGIGSALLTKSLGTSALTSATTSTAGTTLGTTAASSASAASTLIQNGLTLGVGRVSNTGLSIVALIEALQSTTNTNIISTPTLVTMDNEEADIKVGQEVPFVTGQFTNTGATSGSTSVNPFQTIQREQVGIELKITPQINEGDAVLLKIQNEVSSLAPSTGAADLITNKRTLSTAVIVEDGGILVLGGLLQDNLSQKREQVPILGSIPLLGALFRDDNNEKTKTNVMVFIKPSILRNDSQATFESDAKYNNLRNMQLAIQPQKVPMVPNEIVPILPALAPAAPPAIDLRKLDNANKGSNAGSSSN